MAFWPHAFLFISLYLNIKFSCSQYYIQPEQIHLSYTNDPTEMMVTWVTLSTTSASVVEYGTGGSLSESAKGQMDTFTDGGAQKRLLYMHRVKLTGLTPGQTYRYHCGSPDGWSSLYFFNALKSGTDWSPRFAVFGDLGNVNPVSLGRLQEETQEGLYDMFIHVGDFAYDMNTMNGIVGDEFMRQIETIAAYVPYMTCVGNHENAYNFSHYRSRFTMPGNTENLWFSFDLGPIHFVSFSTEVYFYVQYGWELLAKQYAWLENDLKNASSPENRSQRPWIITFGHRPMYCTNNDGDDCTNYESVIRKGLPYIHQFGLEDLFYKYGVDLEIWAHEHSYERLWPVYDRKVYNGSYFAPYTNPKAPVHITTGSAGCQEKHDPFKNASSPWSAFRSTDYGYSRMAVLNASHLYLEQVSDDQGGAVIDKFWLIKDKHGQNAWL